MEGLILEFSAQEPTKTPTSSGDKPEARGRKKSTEKIEKESVKANDR